jgi:hypothetical protein
MKTPYLFHYSRVALFIMAVLCYCACKQPEHKALKPVDKATLLKIVKSLAQAEGSKGSTPEDGVKLLRSYAELYELVITEKAVRPTNPMAVQVFISRAPDFGYFDFNLPAGLRKQLSYQDLDKAYGPGIESPRPKEPLGFSVMYHVPGGGQIAIMATSQEPPPAAKLGIYQITVML